MPTQPSPMRALLKRPQLPRVVRARADVRTARVILPRLRTGSDTRAMTSPLLPPADLSGVDPGDSPSRRHRAIARCVIATMR
jgi:hypothetical protein